MPYAFSFFVAYALGSIPFGFLVARSRGIDIRAAGSGNIGATNVGRQLGRPLGILVFLLDLGKGALPVLAARLLATDEAAVAAAAGAILGHMFPPWLGFRGGKGVATGAGVVAVLLPLPTLIGLSIWLATLAATRFVSLSSLLAASVVAGARLVLTPTPFAPERRTLTAFALLAFGLVAIRHAGNIARLVRGTESQVSESAAMRNIGKVIHVLAVGLWFGSNVFFTFVAAVLIFKTWEQIGGTPFNEREVWLPVNANFNKGAGTRIAGATVGPIFPFFFLIQGLCALLALITSLGFSRAEPRRRVHRVRFWVILLAALTVVGGWPLAQRVGTLRAERYHRDETIAKPADEEFKQLHVVSLFLNFGTIGLVTLATALAAFLPGATTGRTEEKVT